MRNEIIRNAVISVGTSPTLITNQLSDDAEFALRTYVNSSTGGQIITLAFDQDSVTALAGEVLYPAGTHSESNDSIFRTTKSRLYAISSAASGSLSISERIVPASR